MVYASYDPGAGAPVPECAFSVDSTGFPGATSCSSTDTYPFSFARGLGYVDGGNIVDATTWAKVAVLSAPNATLGLVSPDSAAGKVFAFTEITASTGTAIGCAIQSFDLTTRVPIASVRLPTINYSSSDGTCTYNTNVVHWGPNGIALTTYSVNFPSYLIAISGPFVGP